MWIQALVMYFRFNSGTGLRQRNTGGGGAAAPASGAADTKKDGMVSTTTWNLLSFDLSSCLWLCLHNWCSRLLWFISSLWLLYSSFSVGFSEVATNFPHLVVLAFPAHAEGCKGYIAEQIGGGSWFTHSVAGPWGHVLQGWSMIYRTVVGVGVLNTVNTNTNN